MNASVPGGFQWPPAVQSASNSSESKQGVIAEIKSEPALARVWRTVEREWLAPTAEPLRARAAAVGWSPDEFSAYCDRCGHDVGLHEAGEFGCAACNGRRFRWERLVRLGHYEHDLAEWIQEVKFTRWRAQGIALGRWLGERVKEAGFLDAAVANGAGAAVVPMPTTLRRRLARGTDHAAMIALGAARELGVPMVHALRRRHRPSQRSVAPSAREGNVSGVFSRRGERCVRGRYVLLVDDVMTSGATLRAGARALAGGAALGRPRGVWAGVLGVTPERLERRGVADREQIVENPSFAGNP